MSNKIHTGYEVTQADQDFKKSHRSINDELYDSFIDSQLEEIIELAKCVGAPESKRETLEDPTINIQAKEPTAAEIAAQREKDIIANGPIFLAILVVLFTGENSSYKVLAKNMESLNVTMEKISDYTKNLEMVNNKLDQFMQETDPKNMQKLAEEIRDLRDNLSALIDKNKDALSNDLVERLKKYADGSLDGVVAGMGMDGIYAWDDLIGNDEATIKLREYMTAGNGGTVPAPVSTVITNTSNLLGALNTQNSAQLQKLNMITKKVDTFTKLFSSAITMYKGIIQTLTQYSGA